jgi:hypothetical protein
MKYWTVTQGSSTARVAGVDIEAARERAAAIGFKRPDSVVLYEYDFTVRGGGSVYLLQPNTQAAKDWVAEHIPDDAQWLGRAVAVEHRYIANIAEGIEADGLSLGH